MAFNNPPDLASVLRTLSAFSGQSASKNTNENNDNDDNDAYEPPDASPPQSLSTRPPATTTISHHPSRTSPATTSQQQLQGSPPRPKPGSSSSDAALITTWPAALKHVMRTVAQNEEIQRRIRFLIQRQHDHERQWWQGREALVKKQTARAEKKKELDAVLRSVGAPIDTKEVSTVEENQAELRNYDAKVYKASRQMADAMSAELRALDIPFFSLKPGSVSNPTSKSKEARPENAKPFAQGKTLSQSKLSDLQRRVLDLLQDLCKD